MDAELDAKIEKPKELTTIDDQFDKKAMFNFWSFRK
jgi:hypothetical protein